MRLQFAALAAGAALCVAHATVHAQTLTLEDAFDMVSRMHPELRLLDARSAAVAVEIGRAAQRPPLVAGLDVENAAGTGQMEGLRAAETTLTLASVLERGGKRRARVALAEATHSATQLARDARRLDLLADTARRYLAAAAAAQHRGIAATDVQQRRRALDGARERFQAGASPETTVLTAEAALARAELEAARLDVQWTGARRLLAALWGEQDPAFELIPIDARTLPDVPGTEGFITALGQLPDLRRFADSTRIAEARLRLAETGRTPDLSWHVGVRRLEADDDFGLVAGLSLPLGSRTRADAAVRAARLEIDALAVEREAGENALYLTLLDAHARHAVARLEAQRLGDDVLPTLVRAEQAAERAWRAGAASFLEWTAVQADVTATRRQQVDSAVDAHVALIEIQRLTGEAFVLPGVQGDVP